MTILSFSICLFCLSLLAGILGALTGLGGGVVVVPALVLLFKINIHYAMGASLIAVLATSSGASLAYLKEGYTNLRIGLFLETGAIIGAMLGALLIPFISTSILGISLGLILLFSAYSALRRREAIIANTVSHPWAQVLQLEGTYPTANGKTTYQVQHVPLALGLMTFAGMLSGLLGIGAGTVKVLAMDQAMKLPYKVSTATSNFIIGITATVSAGIYLMHGYINPIIAFPVMLGVLLGAFLGAKIMHHVPQQKLRLIFSLVIALLGLQMMYEGLMGSL